MAKLDALSDIMARLRDPETGCPWDIQQSFATIAPYTIEESYEVADAIENNDMIALKDELGDLLLQVVYHAQMAKESGLFALDDVVAAICDKMIRRHPHVFGADNADNAQQVKANWEAIKATERNAKDSDSSSLSGVALALPALMRAEKIQKRAAAVGFDWPNAHGAREKLLEELREVDSAETPSAIEEEIGDLLFSAVNLARHLEVDAELALRKATAKFERRFRAMERATEKPLADQSIHELEQLWQQAKVMKTGLVDD